MTDIRPGYFRLPSKAVGATLIFVPGYSTDLSALELVRWAQQHGFGDIAYVPAKAKPNTGVQA